MAINSIQSSAKTDWNMWLGISGIDDAYTTSADHFGIHLSTMGMQYVAMNEKVTDFHNICIKCGKMCSEHPATGRFNTVILFGHECAWNPDHEFKGFVKNTLKTSGYDLLEFGYE